MFILEQVSMDNITIKPPCGADCFSHISTIQYSVDDGKNDVTKRETSNDTKTANEQWSGQDITLYHLLQPIYGNNHCVIADILQTKTCKQVTTYVCVQIDCFKPSIT